MGRDCKNVPAGFEFWNTNFATTGIDAEE